MDRLSVVVPVYNAMPYLRTAVESILRQTCVEFRFLIINDGSTDGSREYLESIRDPRAIIIHQDNQGLGETLNRSFELCDTEFYARMDADDIAEPDRIAAQVQYLQSHPEVVMVGTQISLLLEDRLLSGHRVPTRHEEIVRSLWQGHPVICHPSIMVRMSAVRAIGGYRIRGAGQDFDFFLRMSEVGRIANMEQVLLRYRIHLNSIVATGRNDIRCGKAYAIASARCRQQGISEPEYSSFRKEWTERHSTIRRIGDRLESWSALQYRRSLLRVARGRWFSGYLGLIPAMACRPGSSLNQCCLRLASRLRRGRHGTVQEP